MSQETHPLVLENEHIQLKAEKHSGCKVIFSITTFPPATKAAQAAASKVVAKEVNIPGFRKGKAPAAVINQQFANQIKREFLDILARNSLQEAIALSKIQPLSNRSHINLLKCEPIDETSYHIEIEFESYPQIPDIDLKALSISKIDPKPITELDITNHIEQLKLHHSTWKDVTDRPAQEGDFVNLQVEIEENGHFDTLHENSRFQLKEGRVPKWLRNLVNGLSIGESAKGVSEPESNETANDFEAKSFKVTLKKIEEPELPELNDALAQKAGVESVELLKEAIKKTLEKDALLQSSQATRLAMKTQLLDSHHFDLPGERLKELRKECDELAHSQAPKGKHQQKSDAMYEDAKHNLAFSYLLSKLFKDHHLKFPSQEAVKQRATEEMISRYMKGDKTITENDLENYMRIAENEMVAETALDFLIEHAKI